MPKLYKLLDENGNQYLSEAKGEFGGYNGKDKIYGRMDCPSSLRWIAKGYYVDKRVFFKDEYTAVMAGFRPCACCMKNEYKRWKQDPVLFKETIIKEHNAEQQETELEP